MSRSQGDRVTGVSYALYRLPISCIQANTAAAVVFSWRHLARFLFQSFVCRLSGDSTTSRYWNRACFVRWFISNLMTTGRRRAATASHNSTADERNYSVFRFNYFFALFLTSTVVAWVRRLCVILSVRTLKPKRMKLECTHRVRTHAVLLLSVSPPRE